MTEKTFEEMELVLGGLANVNPAFIVNAATGFHEASEHSDGESSATGSRSATPYDGRPSKAPPTLDDPFLSGPQSSSGSKRKPPTRADPTAGARLLLDAIQEKWNDDKMSRKKAQKEEKEYQRQQMELGGQILEAQKNLGDAAKEMIHVLKSMADKF
jgi:hypothetical protein